MGLQWIQEGAEMTRRVLRYLNFLIGPYGPDVSEWILVGPDGYEGSLWVLMDRLFNGGSRFAMIVSDNKHTPKFQYTPTFPSTFICKY